MNDKEVNKLLGKHQKWLRGKEGGSRADLHRVDLQWTDFRHADLRESDLHGANCYEADFYGANLSEANLRGTNFKRADLRYVDFSRARLQDANFSRANIDFCCLPLEGESLSIHFDDKQLKQIAYFLVKAGLNSENASVFTRSELRKLKDFANSSHKAKEYGLIEG